MPVKQSAILFPICLAISIALVCGCRMGRQDARLASDISCNQAKCSTAVDSLPPATHFDGEMRQPNPCDAPQADVLNLARPLTSQTPQLPEQRRDIGLDEAITIAMQNAEVLRSLGGQVLRSPANATSAFDPAIQASDPVFGIDAALAQFDTQLAGSLTYANNDDVFNNSIIAGGTNEIQQDLATGTLGLQKVTPAGTRLSLNSNVQYDDNTRPSNLFESAYTTLLEAEARTPLLQGRGRQFNQIAGPNGQPGFRSTSGVLVSRINNDISIAQFEQNVRAMVDEVITAYWQLALAYQTFDALQSSTESAERTWQLVKARYNNDLPGGEADKEAQAREQLYSFKADLAAALGGDRTRGSTGVLQAEANLRRLLNLSENDGVLLHPVDQPNAAEIIYDWGNLVSTAIGQRVELREQAWRIKQQELQLLASRDFIKPRLDAVATYRNNGFGDTLGRSGSSPFVSALQTSFDREYDEWEVGLQLNVPLGMRQANSAVRNSQLQLTRSRAVLREQQNQIVYDLGSALRRADQSQLTLQLVKHRLEAAQQTVDARQAAFEADAASFDELLDAQRRLADAKIAFQQAATDWAIANEGIARESGQLLDNHGVFLEEFQLSVNERVSRSSEQLTDYRLSF